MKLVSFLHNHQSGYGILEGDQIRDTGAVLRDHFPDLKSILDRMGSAAAEDAQSRAPTVPLADVELLPPIPNPAKIFCIGKNYEDHRVETGGEKLSYPTIFLRFADTLVAHGQPAWAPAASTEIDFEGELAVIIGRPGRRIPASRALEHVAGYTCFNDISIRDWQRHTTQFTPGKNFPRTGPLGPWLITADEIPDPQSLALTTRLNGQVVQQASTAEMIFPIRDLIAYISSFTPLAPGDILCTGTPGGVGAKRKPPLFMKPGDTIEIEIESIGTLRNTLIAEP